MMGLSRPLDVSIFAFLTFRSSLSALCGNVVSGDWASRMPSSEQMVFVAMHFFALQ